MFIFSSRNMGYLFIPTSSCILINLRVFSICVCVFVCLIDSAHISFTRIPSDFCKFLFSLIVFGGIYVKSLFLLHLQTLYYSIANYFLNIKVVFYHFSKLSYYSKRSVITHLGFFDSWQYHLQIIELFKIVIFYFCLSY